MRGQFSLVAAAAAFAPPSAPTPHPPFGRLLPQGEKGSRMLTRRFERRLFATLGAAVFALSLAVPAACTSYLQHLGPLDLATSRNGSTIVVDRDGRLLRAFTLPDGRWRLPVTSGEV